MIPQNRSTRHLWTYHYVRMFNITSFVLLQNRRGLETKQSRSTTVPVKHQSHLQIPPASGTGQYLMNTKVISKYHEPQE